MKRKSLVSVAIFSCALALGLPARGEDAKKAASPASGVKNLDAAWTKAVLAGDAAGLAALYADDAVLVMPGAPAVRGGKAIGESLAAFLKDTNVTEFVLMDSHYQTGGHLSAGWGRYKMTTVPKAGGAPTTETGTYCEVAVEKDGVWKYVSDNAAADPAPPAKS